MNMTDEMQTLGYLVLIHWHRYKIAEMQRFIAIADCILNNFD